MEPTMPPFPHSVNTPKRPSFPLVLAKTTFAALNLFGLYALVVTLDQAQWSLTWFACVATACLVDALVFCLLFGRIK
jgi:hypothetical protein